MSATWIIYFAGISLSLSIFLLFATIGCLIFMLIVQLSIETQTSLKPEEIVPWKKRIVASFRVAVACAVLWVAVPSEKTIYLMAGAKVTEDIVKSPEAKEIGGKILKVINSKLDEQIEGKK